MSWKLECIRCHQIYVEHGNKKWEGKDTVCHLCRAVESKGETAVEGLGKD